MQGINRKIVVITPIKNESWILRDFLTAISSFADHIVISDHDSTDDSSDIAKTFPKVELLTTKFRKFAESERRDELLEVARKYGENNLILSIDADEFLTPNLITPQTLNAIKDLEVGTRIHVPLWNVRPDFKEFWTPGLTPIGFIDDGTNHPGKDAIHFPRIPQKTGAKSIELVDGGLLHLQFIQWDRMQSKHRWYQVWETINFPKKSAVDIFRRYDHMNVLPKSAFRKLPPENIDNYLQIGVNLRSLQNAEKKFWWDSEVIEIISKHGLRKFEFLNLDGLDLPEKQIVSLRVLGFKTYLLLTSPMHKRSYWFPLRILLHGLDKFFGPLFVSKSKN